MQLLSLPSSRLAVLNLPSPHLLTQALWCTKTPPSLRPEILQATANHNPMSALSHTIQGNLQILKLWCSWERMLCSQERDNLTATISQFKEEQCKYSGWWLLNNEAQWRLGYVTGLAIQNQEPIISEHIGPIWNQWIFKTSNWEGQKDSTRKGIGQSFTPRPHGVNSPGADHSMSTTVPQGHGRFASAPDLWLLWWLVMPLWDPQTLPQVGQVVLHTTRGWVDSDALHSSCHWRGLAVLNHWTTTPISLGQRAVTIQSCKYWNLEQQTIEELCAGQTASWEGERNVQRFGSKPCMAPSLSAGRTCQELIKLLRCLNRKPHSPCLMSQLITWWLTSLVPI